MSVTGCPAVKPEKLASGVTVTPPTLSTSWRIPCIKQARNGGARQLAAALCPVAVGIGQRQLRRGRADVRAGAVENVERAHGIARDGYERHLLIAQVEHREDVRVRLVGVSVHAVGVLLDLLVHAHKQDRDDVGIVAVELAVVTHRAGAERLLRRFGGCAAGVSLASDTGVPPSFADLFLSA